MGLIKGDEEGWKEGAKKKPRRRSSIPHNRPRNVKSPSIWGRVFKCNASLHYPWNASAPRESTAIIHPNRIKKYLNGSNDPLHSTKMLHVFKSWDEKRGSERGKTNSGNLSGIEIYGHCTSCICCLGLIVYVVVVVVSLLRRGSVWNPKIYINVSLNNNKRFFDSPTRAYALYAICLYIIMGEGHAQATHVIWSIRPRQRPIRRGGGWL